MKTLEVASQTTGLIEICFASKPTTAAMAGRFELPLRACSTFLANL